MRLYYSIFNLYKVGATVTLKNESKSMLLTLKYRQTQEKFDAVKSK